MVDTTTPVVVGSIAVMMGSVLDNGMMLGNGSQDGTSDDGKVDEEDNDSRGRLKCRHSSCNTAFASALVPPTVDAGNFRLARFAKTLDHATWDRSVAENIRGLPLSIYTHIQ